MKERISLQIVENRLILPAVIECASLRVRRHLIEFVIDTGSPVSFLSLKDSMKLQISTKDRKQSGFINLGGSKYEQVSLRKFAFSLLDDDKKIIKIEVELFGLHSLKKTPEKIRLAETPPSILGIDFLKNQDFSLYVNPKENISYLQKEQ